MRFSSATRNLYFHLLRIISMTVYNITFRQRRNKKAKDSIAYTLLSFQEKVRIEIVAYYAGKALLNLLPISPATTYDLFSLNPISITIEYMASKIIHSRYFTFKRTNGEGLLKDFDRNFTIVDNDTGKSIKLSAEASGANIEPKVIIQSKVQSPVILTPMGGAIKKKR